MYYGEIDLQGDFDLIKYDEDMGFEDGWDDE
jgi:hypothetical protein